MPKPNLNRKNFVYYGKTIIIPAIGDIVIANFINFNTYYVLITDVKIDTGKQGTIFTGLFSWTKEYVKRIVCTRIYKIKARF